MPPSQYLPEPQSSSLRQTQVPLVAPPTAALHAPTRHSSSKRHAPPRPAEDSAEQKPVLQRPARHCSPLVHSAPSFSFALQVRWPTRGSPQYLPPPQSASD